MTKTKEFLYTDTMKRARKLYKNMGIPLILFLILFGAANTYVFTPLLGKIWGLVLSTTPEGFVSNSNFVNALLKSPWIVPAGLLLVVAYALIVLWQASAILVGVGYMHYGKRIRLRDLIYISFLSLKDRTRRSNWMVVIYSLIIMPLANVYQTNDLITTFVVPEYIQDFINAKPVLFVISVLLILFVVYIALRWFFLLPAFVLKGKDFKEAKAESNTLTAKHYVRNGISIVLYSLVELLRLSLIPMALILLPVFICYLFTCKTPYATNLFNIIGLDVGLNVIRSITGTLTQISTMCFLIELYSDKQKEYGIEEAEPYRKLKFENSWKITVTKLQVICSVLFSVLIFGLYFGILKAAQNDESVILDMFGRTEIIAHKGYSTKAPENTMDAFELAEKCEPVTMIELDVRSTKDGVPVVIHNATTGDAAGIDKEIYEYTFEELKDLPAPYGMADQYPDARIPSLEEVLSTYADKIPFLIEIKGYKQDPELPAKIVELMKKYGCEYTCAIHSGDYGAIEAVKKIDPDIRCGLILAMVTGNYYDLPYADFFSIEHSFVNRNVVSLVNMRGKQVYAWTVNYAESVEDLLFTGVDGLITDVPEEVYEYVADSNELINNVSPFTQLQSLFDDEAVSNAVQHYQNEEY